MTDQFKVEPCPLCSTPMERMGGQTVWEHPGDDCPLAMIQIPLASLDGWNARSTPPIPMLKAGAEPYLITPHIERCVSAFLHGYSTVDGHRLSGIALALAAERDTAQAEVERLNEWADTFSDAQQKERGLAEARIKELERRVRDLTNGGPYATGVHDGWNRAAKAAAEVFEKHTPTHTDEVEAAYEAITAMKGKPL